MAFVAAPTIIKAALFYTMNGQPAMNRIHIKTSTTNPTASQCAVFAAAIASWWDGNIRALVPTTMQLNQVVCQSVSEPNGSQATFSSGLPHAGTNVGLAEPNNVAFCVSLRSGLTGRSARGRWYHGGLTEDQVAGNEVIPGAVVSIVGAMDNLISAITAAGGAAVIVSYVHDGIPRPGGPVYFVITDALAVDNIVDSQRGRLH